MVRSGQNTIEPEPRDAPIYSVLLTVPVVSMPFVQLDLRRNVKLSRKNTLFKSEANRTFIIDRSKCAANAVILK